MRLDWIYIKEGGVEHCRIIWWGNIPRKKKKKVLQRRRRRRWRDSISIYDCTHGRDGMKASLSGVGVWVGGSNQIIKSAWPFAFSLAPSNQKRIVNCQSKSIAGPRSWPRADQGFRRNYLVWPESTWKHREKREEIIKLKWWSLSYIEPLHWHWHGPLPGSEGGSDPLWSIIIGMSSSAVGGLFFFFFY